MRIEKKGTFPNRGLEAPTLTIALRLAADFAARREAYEPSSGKAGDAGEGAGGTSPIGKDLFESRLGGTFQRL